MMHTLTQRRYGWCWTTFNTHKLGSLYDAFKPAEARRIAKRLEFHYTPLHGSWLNMAVERIQQCLNRLSDEVTEARP